MEKEVWPLVKGFKDTPFIVYMLKKRSCRTTGVPYIDSVFFEEEIGFNRHWLQVAPSHCHVGPHVSSNTMLRS